MWELVSFQIGGGVRDVHGLPGQLGTPRRLRLRRPPPHHSLLYPLLPQPIPSVELGRVPSNAASLALYAVSPFTWLPLQPEFPSLLSMSMFPLSCPTCSTVHSDAAFDVVAALVIYRRDRSYSDHYIP